MRIRTIKPEFWTHPFWARQKDDVRLLAVAILNYADDDGYFYADAELVREVQPFWSVEKIRRSIVELSQHGYIELSETPLYGLIGRVVNFSIHQRIDRPKSSKIKDLWDSTTNRRKIDDQSSPEQGNKGTREQGNKGIEFFEFIPSNLSSPEFITAWSEWVKHRREVKKPITKTAGPKQLEALSKMGEQRAIAAIENSITNGYQGIFEAKPTNGKSFTPAKSNPLNPSWDQYDGT